MANTINPYIYSAYNSAAYQSTAVQSSPFDVSSAQKTAKQQASELLDAYTQGRDSVKSLKKETAQYLDQYTLSMKQLGQSADAVRLGNLDKVLYDTDGNVTDKTVEDTVKAVQTMVDNYNSSLKLLNDNADRGPGTVKQLARMAQDPAPADGMKLVGVTVNKDGTLALDAEKMTEALKTTNQNQLALYKDIIGGFGGIADGVQKDAAYGSNMSARELIRNDLANIQQTQNSNPFREMYNSFKGSAYALNNQMVTGLLMNMLA